MILIDTNIIIDVTSTDAVLAQRAARAIRVASRRAVGPIVYAELAPGFVDMPTLDAALLAMQVELSNFSRAGLFLAGEAFKAYRLRGGPRDRMLPDFLIGAQAVSEECPLLTRDPARYRTAFPQLQLIEP